MSGFKRDEFVLEKWIPRFINCLDIDGDCLVKAISMTFRTRRTTIDTNSIVFNDAFFQDKNKQKQWSAFLRKRHITDAPEKFSDIARDVMAFLRPCLERASLNE